MFLLIAHYGSLSFASVFEKISASGVHGGFLTAIALLLVVGATGKSAQIPLYVWLPDAMEGPTPVSALIHAATMVTAGVYMVARCHVLFDRAPIALAVVACIGAATALFAAIIGVVQHDIKRVLAYSTISQLGYMFLACGVGAYTAGIFHLVTHAFFKALLFLAAGSVIHALDGEQDMRKMGGLRKRIPVTFYTMSAGVFAIAGLPPFAGFFSKDEILYLAFTGGPLDKVLWFVGLLTAGITSFYMFRLWFKTFFGAERFDNHQGHPEHPALEDHGHSHVVHESPWVMLLPLAVLALLSLTGGWIGIPGHSLIEGFLDPVFETVTVGTSTGNTEAILAVVSVLTALIGLYFAYAFYCKRPGTAVALAKRFAPVYSLVEHKFYIDEIYETVFVSWLLFVARILLYGIGDRIAIDGSGWLAGWFALLLGEDVRRIQSGNLRSYAGWLALGAALIMAVMIFGFGHWAFAR
jgi:NADH-quinone oxidoreductase subunit L